ncbi:ORF50 [Helicoverpa armigera SNPV]|uniref:ORF51 n=2 Tax=Alphabaculovirus helarmigerae TaxID=3047947 RepID=Q8V5U4_9ABAC|nr:ORF51 [Helicoverpa zea single nucleopolyhedrovirus]AIG63092.1 ORF50 [Helicoverpa SNPV AC53]AIG63229.1 ORF50 [Helicoverpa armigera SNPV]AHN05426.1 ORF51 [Helicoverpa zea single nucleopolyhedrovirus]AKN50471.1 hypothetical protein [Helicoverpa zea single nucleopolyhedrovirus]
MQSARYIERDQCSIDMRHIRVSCDQNNQSNNADYIIFLMVKRAFYQNFQLTTDMSMESLTLYLFDNLIYCRNGHVRQYKHVDFVEYIFFNEQDKNQSMIIELDHDARVIVAKRLHDQETYHQRVSGYMDFEKRHNTTTPMQIIMNSAERAEFDRTMEITLLND